MKMRSVFAVLLCLICLGGLHAQYAIMPAQTIAAINVVQKDLQVNRDVPSAQIVDMFPIYRMNGEYYVAVLCKVNSDFNKARAIRDGFEVGTIIGSIATMRIPIQLLQENFSYPGITYLEVAEKISPALDAALKDIRADLVHQGTDLPQAYTGKNVCIGIVDWGFDYTHPMFYDTTLDHTRILAAWDQVKKEGTPPEGFSHGAVYIGADELLAAQHDTISSLSSYHGTHVAGIAGGSGGGTKYRGTGFESDLLFSQMRNDVSSSIDAFQWMYNMAQAAGKRLVINNSWGNYRLFPLDGTSLMSQAIDAFSEMGVVFVFSAGNNGDINFHLKKDFANDSVLTRIMGFNYSGDADLWGQSVGMWGEPGHPFSAQLRILDNGNNLVGQSEMFNTETTTSYVDTFLVIGTDTIVYHLTTDAAHPLNGRPQMTMDIQNKNTALKSILYAAAPDGTLHCWNTRFTVYGIGNWGYGFTAPKAGYVNGDKNHGIGHPAVTESVITCAAHQTNFHLTAFSSYGPRMDGFQKPDISAPGQDIISSFNSFSSANFTPVEKTNFMGREYEWVRLSGTSMSAPMVTGAVALMLEADPTLSPAEVKAILLDAAREDPLTGDIPSEGHNRWGHGKLDVYTAIQHMTGTAIGEITFIEGELFPIPALDRVYVTTELSGEESYHLLARDGKGLASGQFGGSLYVGDLPSGLYFLCLKNGSKVRCYRVVVAK